MDVLLKSLESRGYEIFMSEPTETKDYGETKKHPSATGVHIDNIAVEFGLEEVIESVRRGEPRPKGDDFKKWWEWRERNPPPHHVQRPTGRLALIIRGWGHEGRRTWSDGKNQRVEDVLNVFVSALVEAAARSRQREAERERRRLEAAERMRLEEERERLRMEEEARRQDLDLRLAELEFATKVRQLVEATRRRSGGADELPPATDAWCKWAMDVAAEAEDSACAEPNLVNP